MNHAVLAQPAMPGLGELIILVVGISVFIVISVAVLIVAYGLVTKKSKREIIRALLFWITGAIGTTRHLIQASIMTDMSLLTLWGPLYIAFAGQIYWMLYRIGNFKPYTALFFPIPIFFFVVVFVYSFLVIFVRRNVRWKGRTIAVKSRGGK